MRNACRILVANTAGKTHFGVAWDDIIEMDFKYLCYGV
jgi:hypothetical protein